MVRASAHFPRAILDLKALNPEGTEAAMWEKIGIIIALTGVTVLAGFAIYPAIRALLSGDELPTTVRVGAGLA